eukprot:COSAG01_NODE_6591_length_3589_cov_13.533524_5_plen_140_part_00
MSYLSEIVTGGVLGHKAKLAVGPAFTGSTYDFDSRALLSTVAYGSRVWLLLAASKAHASVEPVSKVFWNEAQLRAEGSATPKSAASKIRTPLFCVQRAGDVLLLPSSWSRAVLNTRQTVAVELELEFPENLQQHREKGG